MKDKVIFNGICYGKGKEYYGVQRFESELLKELDRQKLDYDCEVVVPVGSEIFDSFTNVRVKKINFGRNAREVKIWNLLFFPLYCKWQHGLSIDLILTYPIFGCDISAVHDCIMEREAQGASAISFSRRLYFWRIRRNVDRCKKIVTVSNFSKDDITNFYGISDDKIVIIPNAWQHFQRIEADNSILKRIAVKPGEYYFALGSRSKRKNDKWVISAAKQSPNKTFVISGSTNFEGNAGSESIPENVIFTGYLTDEEIKSLMANCTAFIQPSIIEGFGIPPMEAMSAGANCIVSNTSSLPEIYRNSVWYIDPLNYENINLEDIMANEIESKDLILNRFSWEKSSLKLNSLIREVLHG